jgi:hypothetical protein
MVGQGVVRFPGSTLAFHPAAGLVSLAEMVGQGVVRFPDGTLAFHPSRGFPTKKGSS